MHPHEDKTIYESKQSKRRRNYEFYFFEQIGNRFYFRFTQLGVITILLLTVIPLAAILILFVTQQPPEKVDVQITPPPATPFDPNKSIIEPPPRSTPRAIKPIRPPKMAAPTPSPLPSPKRTTDEQLMPQPSPVQTPGSSSNPSQQ